MKNNQTNRKIICQNCGAVLADIDKNASYIHLPEENIKARENNLIELKCRCGCITQYYERRLES